MGLWQWLTGAGRGHRDGASDPASAEPGSGRPADSPAPPAGGSVPSATSPTPPVRQGWSSAPVMPRAVVQTSLLSDSARFERSLTTRQNPGFLRPLGHAVSSAAPTGVIHGLIEPAGAPVTIQGAPPLPAPAGPAPLRVQRSAPRPAPRPPLIVAAPQAEARRMPVVPAPAGHAVQRRVLPTSAQADVDSPRADQSHADQSVPAPLGGGQVRWRLCSARQTPTARRRRGWPPALAGGACDAAPPT